MSKSNSEVPLSNIKYLIIEFDLEFNNKKYTFNLFDIGNDTLEILAKENFDENNEIIELNKYNIILQLEELKNTINQMNNIITDLMKRISILEANSENKRIEIRNSNIIKSNEELRLLFNAISSNQNNLSLQLLYDSNIEGENSEKFKSSYINKNDIIIYIT